MISEEVIGRSLLIISPPPAELQKATDLCILAWKNYGQAVKDCMQGRITPERRNTYFRVALRIEVHLLRLQSAWNKSTTRVLLPCGEFYDERSRVQAGHRAESLRQD